MSNFIDYDTEPIEQEDDQDEIERALEEKFESERNDV